MFDINKIEQVKFLFNETERAHQEEAAISFKGDPEWPLWYAKHMKLRLEEILDRHFTVGELVCLLISAENTHKKNSPDSEWTDFYAKYLLDKHLFEKETSDV